MYGRMSDPGMGPFSPGVAGPRRWPEGKHSPRVGSMNPSQLAISGWRWDAHTVRSRIDPEDHRLHPRVVRIVDVWRYL